MQDRVPLYPGRVTLTPVSGQANTFDLLRADQPTQEGTPINKASLLKDATAALFGLGTGAVPDDVLAELGKYKQYWWRRRAKTVVEKRTNITGEVQVTRDASPGRQFYYSKTVSLDPNGGVSLVSPVTLDGVASSTTSANALSESLKPYLDDVPYYISSDIVDGKIYYVPTGSHIGYNSVNPGYFTFGLYRYSSKTLYMVLSDQSLSDVKVPAQLVEGVVPTGDWEYLRSSNRNAYPDSGIQDGYEYEYMGVPLDNAVTAPKIDTGSYTGTGTYGASNPNSLTFDFEPKILLVLSNDATGGMLGIRGAQKATTGLATYIGTDNITFNQNVVSWYYSSGGNSSTYPYIQMNQASMSYYYIAIG